MAGNNKRGAVDLVLGVDVGTTTVKVALVEADTRKIVQTQCRETKARRISDLGTHASEQDVPKIMTALQFCLSRLPKEHLQRVVRVGVSGQMHGVVLWKQAGGWIQNQYGRFEAEADAVTVLYTWQDGRCSTDFLSTLPVPESHLSLSSGHGCATLFWLQRHQPEFLAEYDRAGTVQDMLVAMLAGLDRPVMSEQNAASWGYFDTTNGSWNVDRLEAADFPVHLLPTVVSSGNLAGNLCAPWYGIPVGAEVGVAMGDMQCSVYSTLQENTDAVLNISTSAQLSFIMPESFTPPEPPPDQDSAIQYFPYFKNRYLAVAASLNGGNVLATFVRTLQQWAHMLGLGVPDTKIWEKIIELAGTDDSAASDLTIVPTLYGERHLPNQRASVTNICPLNLSLGKVFMSLCRGVIGNVYSMMPRSTLEVAGVQRIVGCGSALSRNVILQKELVAQYALPVIYAQGKRDAAVGVALALLDGVPDSAPE